MKYRNVSTTQKNYILIDDLEDYYDLANVTLRKVTDELIENMHKFFAGRLVKSMYYIKEESNCLTLITGPGYS